MTIDPVLSERLAKLMCPYCRVGKPLADGFHEWSTKDGEWEGKSRVRCERLIAVAHWQAEVATAYAEMKAAEARHAYAYSKHNAECNCIGRFCLWQLEINQLGREFEAAKAKWEGIG